MSIVPLHGRFENPKAFLHHIAEDGEIAAVAIVVFRKDGTCSRTHLNCDAMHMVYAGAVLTELGLNPDDEI